MPLHLLLKQCPSHFSMLHRKLQEGQGTFAPDENDPTEYPAMGTPGAWTTNDPTDDFYYSLNSFGPHYWFIVMDMDCDQTQGGWFEFNTVYSIGGEDGESAIAQVTLKLI